MSKKFRKKRVPNFSPSEIALLTRLAKKYSHIFEIKKTNTATNVLKEKTWDKLAQDFNRFSRTYERSAKVLRTKYDGIKKKKIGEHYRNLYDIGAGPLRDANIKDASILELADTTLGDSPAPFDTNTVQKHENPPEVTIEVEHNPRLCDIDHDYIQMNEELKDNAVNDTSEINKTSNEFPLKRKKRKPLHRSSETLINTTNIGADLSKKKKQLIEAQIRSIEVKMKQDAKEHDLRCELMLLEIMLKKRELKL